MKHPLARVLCAASILTLSSPAFAVEDIPAKMVSVDAMEISQIGDLEKSCGSLSQEAANMRDVIHAMQDVKHKSEMQSHGITAAGAVGSFLIGSVTGGIGLAVGGFLLDHNVGEREEEADQIQDIAEQRRTLMMGIYKAKECHGPLEHAMLQPEDFDPIEQLALNEEAKYQTELRRRYNN